MLPFSTMVLDLPFLRKLTKKLLIPSSQILCLMNLGIFTCNPSRDWENTFHALLHQSNPTEVDGNSSSNILDGNLNNLPKPHTRLPQNLEVQSLNMVTSRQISSPGILLSTFVGGTNLLLLILSIVTHLPSMMETPWQKIWERLI